MCSWYKPVSEQGQVGMSPGGAESWEGLKQCTLPRLPLTLPQAQSKQTAGLNGVGVFPENWGEGRARDLVDSACQRVIQAKDHRI